MTRFFTYVEGLGPDPYMVWGLVSLAVLLMASGLLLMCVAKWNEHRQTPVDHRPDPAQIHQAVRRVRTFAEPAKKGATAGFTRDDRVVEDITTRRRLS
jgi:hypothetical protein